MSNQSRSWPSSWPCPWCGQEFLTNPDDPPPPHKKVNSEEDCISREEWLALIEECP